MKLLMTPDKALAKEKFNVIKTIRHNSSQKLKITVLIKRHCGCSSCSFFKTKLKYTKYIRCRYAMKQDFIAQYQSSQNNETSSA